MVYRNNAGRLGSGFIRVCLKTCWLGQGRGFYVLERLCSFGSLLATACTLFITIACETLLLIWQRICYLTPSLLLFLTNSVAVITEFLNSIHFQYNESVKWRRQWNQMAHRQVFRVLKKSAAGQIFCGKVRRRQNSSNKMRRRQFFFD